MSLNVHQNRAFNSLDLKQQSVEITTFHRLYIFSILNAHPNRIEWSDIVINASGDIKSL
jgi:hypothetical protein